MAIRNAFMAEVKEHSIDSVLRVDSECIVLALGRHVLDSEDVHFLVLVVEVLGKDVSEGLGSSEHRVRVVEVLRVVGRQVYDR